MMKPIAEYQQALQLRNSLKSVQQFSWEISQLEKTYPLDQLETKEDIQALIEAYTAMLKRALDTLKDIAE